MEQPQNEAVAVCQRRLAQLAGQERRLQEDLARIVHQARRGEITTQEQRAFAQALEAERQELAAQRDALQRQLAEMLGTPGQLEELPAWVARVDWWHELEPDVQ